MRDEDDAPIRTGHDLHFLSRLPRVDEQRTDLALRLYRDPELVRALLADPAAGASSDRVAIALGGEPSACGHVVLTRQGRFVTCLGPEMAVSDSPIVPWERVRIHVRRAEEASRSQAALDEKLESGALRRLLLRSATAGTGLTREEFEELSVLEPLMASVFAGTLIDLLDSLLLQSCEVARIKRIHRDDVPVLRNYWNRIHHAGHLLLLSGLGGRRTFDSWDQVDVGAEIDPLVAYLTPFRFGYAPLTLRALWMVARSGKAGLARLKRWMPTATSTEYWLRCQLGIVAIAVRHQRLRHEAASALGDAHMPSGIKGAESLREAARALRGMLREGGLPSGDSEEIEARSRARCAEFVARLGRTEEECAPEEIERLAANPFVLPMFASLTFDYWTSNRGLDRLVFAMIQVIPLPAAELFYPARALRLAREFNPEEALAIAAPFRPDGPIRAEPQPGRNEPCKCGSGRKFKRCCGAPK